MDIFETIRNKRLEKDKNFKYTLGDEIAESTLGIKGREVLTPDDSNIALFGAATYLFGIFGINVETFTSIPAGFLAHYSKKEMVSVTKTNDAGEEYVEEEEKETFSGTFMTFEPSIISELVRLCDEKVATGEHTEFYEFMKETLTKAGLTLFEKSLIIASRINKEKPDGIKHNISAAKAAFKDKNEQNCKDNDVIIRDIIIDSIVGDCNGKYPLSMDLERILKLTSEVVEDLGLKDSVGAVLEKAERSVMTVYIAKGGYSEEYANILRSVVKRYHDVFDAFIIAGYYTYRGTDKKYQKIDQDSQILNRFDRILKLKDLLGYEELTPKKKDNIVTLLNICSTDYSADMVERTYDEIGRTVLTIGTKEEVQERAQEIISTSIPKTPNNRGRKEATDIRLFNLK